MHVSDLLGYVVCLVIKWCLVGAEKWCPSLIEEKLAELCPCPHDGGWSLVVLGCLALGPASISGWFWFPRLLEAGPNPVSSHTSDLILQGPLFCPCVVTAEEQVPHGSQAPQPAHPTCFPGWVFQNAVCKKCVKCCWLMQGPLLLGGNKITGNVGELHPNGGKKGRLFSEWKEPTDSSPFSSLRDYSETQYVHFPSLELSYTTEEPISSLVKSIQLGMHSFVLALSHPLLGLPGSFSFASLYYTPSAKLWHLSIDLGSVLQGNHKIKYSPHKGKGSIIFLIL